MFEVWIGVVWGEVMISKLYFMIQGFLRCCLAWDFRVCGIYMVFSLFSVLANLFRE